MRDGPVRHLHRPPHHKASWPSPATSCISISVITELEPPRLSSSPHLHNNSSTANPNPNAELQQGELLNSNKPRRTRFRTNTVPCSKEAKVASSEGMAVARRRSERLNCHSHSHSHRDSSQSDVRCLRPRRNCQVSIISDAANNKRRKPRESTKVRTPVKRRSSSFSDSRPQRRKRPRSNGYLLVNHMNFDERKDSPVNESSPASLESFNGEGSKVLELGADGSSSSSSIDSSGSSGAGEMVRTIFPDQTNQRCLEEDNSPPTCMEEDNSPLQINDSSVVTALRSGLPDANFNEGGCTEEGNDVISIQEGYEDGEGSHHGGCTEVQNNGLIIQKGREDGEGSQITWFHDETPDNGKIISSKEKEIDEEASTISHYTMDQGDFNEHQPYLPGLDDESALRCLAFLPLCEVGRLVGVNRQYRELVEQGVISKLRHGYGLIEQWVFIYTSDPSARWTAYSPKHNIWKTLPRVDVDPFFNMSDKESLSVGTQVLWLGREGFDFVYYRYDILTNLWEKGPPMANPRWLFAWATCDNHQFAFVAGGYGPGGPNGGLGGLRVLDTAERYNSLTGEWESLPSMSMPRQKCSGFFMDGKFYVIGGKDANHRQILSGEEYDPIAKTWKVIEDMYFEPAVALPVESSPPLVAVVNNQLYAVDNTVNILKIYDKKMNKWIDLGYLPVRTDAHNGWGVAFKACGDRLFLMGDDNGITAYSWQPGPGADAMVPNWQTLYQHERGDNTFLLNCAVMVY